MPYSIDLPIWTPASYSGGGAISIESPYVYSGLSQELLPGWSRVSTEVNFNTIPGPAAIRYNDAPIIAGAPAGPVSIPYATYLEPEVYRTTYAPNGAGESELGGRWIPLLLGGILIALLARKG